MKKELISCCVLLMATAVTLSAKPSPEGGDRQGPPAEGGRKSHRPLPPPMIMALDTNHDGILSAEEIARAPQALLTLDKNGDGQLDHEELRPPRPHDAPEGDEPPPGPPRKK
jgi:hypothetical protein